MPMDVMTSEQQYLLKEFDLAVRLTYHIDDLRSRVSSFFLAFAGAGGAALAILMKGDHADLLTEELLAGLFLGVAVLGGIAVLFLAKCRRAQLEHYRIINNVRTHFLGSKYDLWNVVQLSARTLPRRPSRQTGAYVWLVQIILVTCALIAAATFIFLESLEAFPGVFWDWLCSVLCFSLAFAGLDGVYMRAALPPCAQRYSKNHSPL